MNSTVIIMWTILLTEPHNLQRKKCIIFCSEKSAATSTATKQLILLQKLSQKLLYLTSHGNIRRLVQHLPHDSAVAAAELAELLKILRLEFTDLFLLRQELFQSHSVLLLNVHAYLLVIDLHVCHFLRHTIHR